MYREEFSRLSQVIGVIHNKQPAILRSQPALDGVHYLLLIRLVLFRELEQLGQRHEVIDERFTGSSPHPEYMRIIIAKAIGIFCRRLRFTDASQSIERLWLGQGSRSRSREPLVEGSQQRFATGEKDILGNRNVLNSGKRR